MNFDHFKKYNLHMYLNNNQKKKKSHKYENMMAKKVEHNIARIWKQESWMLHINRRTRGITTRTKTFIPTTTTNYIW